MGVWHKRPKRVNQAAGSTGLDLSSGGQSEEHQERRADLKQEGRHCLAAVPSGTLPLLALADDQTADPQTLRLPESRKNGSRN